MNEEPSTPNVPAPAERPAGAKPEDLQVGAESAPAPAPEVASNPPAGAPAPAPASAAAKLSAADVAAAIAATPTPTVRPTSAPTPSTASDVDVIEPEWVDKAEEVVRAHHGDPYGEEEAVEVLQEDYLQKRYGISVADPNKPDAGKPKGT